MKTLTRFTLFKLGMFCCLWIRGLYFLGYLDTFLFAFESSPICTFPQKFSYFPPGDGVGLGAHWCISPAGGYCRLIQGSVILTLLHIKEFSRCRNLYFVICSFHT